MATVPKTKSISSTMLERLQALDPTDPGSASVLMDVVIALDERQLSAEEAKAIYAEIDRITEQINRLHVKR